MKLYAVYFSPTGGTKKVLDELVKEWLASGKTPQKTGKSRPQLVEVDLSDRMQSAMPLSQITPGREDFCIIAVPSYGGRVPAAALERLSRMKADHTPAVLTAAYGNRAYDDTLLELQAAAKHSGFCPVAAIAAVTEHSIMHQFGTGRPDAQDKAELRKFVRQIKEQLRPSAKPSSPAAAGCRTASCALTLPGSHPYREYKGIPLKPKAGKACNGCGACAKACPVGAISGSHPEQTDKHRCISCMRCIQICPAHARSLNKIILTAAGCSMKKVCSGRKKNELYSREQRAK